MTWFRALLAGALSILFPGAGHAFLRDWLRAVVFAGLYLSAIAIFLPMDQLAAAETMTDAVTIVSEDMDSMGQFALSFIGLFAAIDATFRSLGFPPTASGSGAGSSDGPTCPECGKELDEDLEFCHWCTTRLEPAEPEEAEPSEA
ncbi:DUF7575 domain-containing protein [Halopiger aswanensis]|uniref:DUF7575 domain-containing protein n=1 Tax=Halopiger aswanensis TaxID=148449 RepID=A0A419WIN0_9EURY|nr:zinc ribbon domain-containing protein [Halopiger aswanensis]RKD95306.1 hypothetical protein ATJ93_2158 [Halopiger aswanensis]